MAAYNKFDSFVDYLVGNVSGQAIAVLSDTFKVMLTNTIPVHTNKKYSDISGNELANGNGYTTGGAASAVTSSNTAGTETVAAANYTWTCVTSPMGPFEYVVFYDTTPTDKPLVAWWDYGSAVTLGVGETFTFEPSGGDLFTLA